MDIFIKSFNRVYYLNRCLYSINIYLENFSGHIYILDDGTPKAYLDIIKKKYPNIIILKSNDYIEKSTLIENKDNNLPKKIPSQFWYNSIKKSSDYCLILEDDLWFTKKIDIKALETFSKTENIALFKLLWLGNTSVISSKEDTRKDDYILYKPNLPFKSLKIFKLIYAKYNPLWRQILKVLKIYSYKSELRYYSIYSVAGAVFRKDYFLDIWKNSESDVDEKKQLTNALKFYNQHDIKFGRTDTELIKTGFVSSAFTKATYKHFSIHDFNTTLNEYWLQNTNAFENNLDLDISEEDIEGILKVKKKSQDYISEWKDWVSNFKASYRKIGCTV